MTVVISRLGIGIAFVAVMASSRTSSAQPSAVVFAPTPLTNCTAQHCSAGEALRYLLWSRQSDNNRCKFILDTSGNNAQRGACDTLVPSRGEPPVDDIGVVNALIQFLNTQTNTFPLPWGSSTGGFAFVIDPGSGAPIPTTRSLGPLFSDRALTSGRGTWTVNVSFQHTDWERIDGTPLTRIVSEQFRVGGTCGSPTCLSLRWTANLRYSTTHVVTGVAYGITDNAEIAVSVPTTVAQVRGTAFISSDFSKVGPEGTPGTPVSVSGRSVGVGDIRVLAKYALMRTDRESVPVRVAWAGELRLPTGDPEALTGIGRLSGRTTIIASLGSNTFAENLAKRIGANFSASYVWAGSGIQISNPGLLSDRSGGASLVGDSQYAADFSVQPSNEFDYTAAGDLPLSRRLTLSAEYLGRKLLSSAKFGNISFRNDLFSQPFMFERASALLQVAAFGGKVQIADHWVVSSHILVPLSKTGITAGITPVFALERVSTRPGTVRRN